MRRAPMSRRGWLRTVLAAAGVAVASPAPRTLGAPAGLKMPDDIPLETFDFESSLKREELIAINSMILHELYFDALGAEGEADRALRDALVRDFGSVERWRAEFVAMDKAMGGGAGWVLLTYSSRDRKLVNQWAADHTHGLAGGSPILALDMYEHSYHLDYGAAAAKYVDASMENIRWDHVSRLHQQYAG